MANISSNEIYVSDAFSGWPGFSKSRTVALHEALHAIESRDFGPHPFTTGISGKNLRDVLEQYVVMSTEFPFIQARAIGNAYFHRNDPEAYVPLPVQLTSVVGSFLVFDEFGAHAKVREGGNAALPQILNTQGFHSNLLRADCSAILGEEIGCNASAVTRAYLDQLAADLGATDHIIRIAAMIAFEQHAGSMIDALWQSVAVFYNGNRSNLGYFHTHVGGDDPAEAYHQQMTARLIELCVPAGREEQFLDAFRQCYALNWNWCEEIKGGL